MGVNQESHDDSAFLFGKSFIYALDKNGSVNCIFEGKYKKVEKAKSINKKVKRKIETDGHTYQ